MENYPRIKSMNAIGRVYAVHPNNKECYYLQLLHKIKGPRPFAELRTVNGILKNTYHEACTALVLLENDDHWKEVLKKASEIMMPNKMRNLFAIMLTACNLSNPGQLWLDFQDSFCEETPQAKD